MNEINLEIEENIIEPVMLQQEISNDLEQNIVEIEINPIEINATIQQPQINVEVNSWRDGQSAYIYFARALDSLGNGFTLTFNPALSYFAMLQSTTQITPVVWDFSWLRVKYKWSDWQNWQDWTNWTDWQDWISITGIQLVWTVWLQDTYRITFSDGTHSDYIITNWQNGTNWQDWQDGQDWTDWNWISSIELLSTIWLENTYRIHFTDWSHFDYIVKDWVVWQDWDDWNWIEDIELISTIWLEKTYRITFTDQSTFNYVVTDWADWLPWQPWNPWQPWQDWNGIVSITLISTVGLDKTYRILFTDTTTFDYVVSDWEEWPPWPLVDDMLLDTFWFNQEYDNGNSWAAKTIDYTIANNQKVTLTADCIFTFTPIAWWVSRVQLKVIQDWTGWWNCFRPANVIRPNGYPTWTDWTPWQNCIITFYYDWTNYIAIATLYYNLP